MTDLNFTINVSTASEIYLHLFRCDNNFSPRLSDRLNVESYSIKIRSNATTFEVWNSSNALIGLVAVYLDKELKTAFITNVSVEKNYMGKGISKKLMQNSIDYLKNNFYKQVKLEVFKSNEIAISLYRKFGFIECSEEGNSIIMKLKF